MKALTLNSLERKAEAYECIRLGVRNNLRSPVCEEPFKRIFNYFINNKTIKKIGRLARVWIDLQIG